MGKDTNNINLEHKILLKISKKNTVLYSVCSILGNVAKGGHIFTLMQTRHIKCLSPNIIMDWSIKEVIVRNK